MANKFLRLPAVIEATGLSRSAIYKKILLDQFPAQIKLGQRSVAWLESDIQEWIEQQIHRENAHEI